MIFNTFKSDTGGFANNFGLFGASFQQIKQYGLGSAFGKLDTNVLLQYNEAIKSGCSHTQACNVALTDLDGNLINVNNATKQAMETANGQVISLEKINSGARASAIGMGLLKAAMNFGIMMAITGLIELGKYLWKLVPTTEHLKEKLEETAQALADIKSESESIKDELKTIQDRISELESKGALSFTDEAELTRLKQQNAELQRKIDLNDVLQKQARKENNETFVSTMNSDVNSDREYVKDLETGKIRKGDAAYTSGQNSSERLYINQEFEDFKKAQDELVKLEQDYLDGKISKEKFDSSKKRIDKEIKETSKYLTGKQGEFAQSAKDIEYIKNPTTEDEKAVNAWLDYINDFNDRLAITLGGDNAKENTISRLLDTSFANIGEKLKELGEKGDITAEMLNSPEYDAFINKLIELGVITDKTPKSLEFVALAFNKVEEAAEGATSNIQTFSDVFKSIKEGADVLADAYSDIEDGGEISLEHLMSLLDKYPDLVEYVNLENGQHNITIGILKAKFEAEKKAQLAKITASKAAVNAEIAEQKAILDTIATKKEKAKQDMAETMVSIGQFKTVGDALNAINARPGYYLRGFDWDVNNAKVAITDAENQLKTLNAQETLIKNMSWDDIVSGSGSGKSGSATNETAEDKIDNLKHRHEMGIISEATYYKELEKIRKKYYAGKKKYLDRDRELQEEYHDWEIKDAEDGFEDKVEALQEKYANGKITYAELKSKLKKLINTTFKNDKDTKNKYLDELPEYLEDAKEKKEEKNREKFDSSYDKLKYQLENGFITEKNITKT